jgi:branched-chain amino acid transport system substrate-binding protein
MKRIWVLFLAAVVACLSWGSSPAIGADPIVVGIPTSLTHLDARDSVKAVEMAVEEINAKGGVKVGKTKRPIKIEKIDLRDSSPGIPVSEALLGLEKIITEKKPHALLIGPFRSEALLAGMDIIAKYKVPLLGTIAMTPKSEVRIKENPNKYKYIFRVALNAQYLVRYLVETLGYLKNEFGFSKLFVMHQDVLWARATASRTSEVASKNLGIEIVGTEAYPTGSSDFSSGLMKAKVKGAHVIMPVFDMAQSGILLKQWKSMKIPALVSGFISPMAGPGAWKTFDGKIGDLLNVNFELGSAIAPKKYAPAKEFYEKYEKKYGKPVEGGHGPGPSYDSVYILAEAIERAGSTDPDKLVAELEKTDRQGVIGRIKFDEGHQVVFGADPTKTACAAVTQWTNDGKRVIVFPVPLAEGKIKLPSWMKPVKKGK